MAKKANFRPDHRPTHQNRVQIHPGTAGVTLETIFNAQAARLARWGPFSVPMDIHQYPPWRAKIGGQSAKIDPKSTKIDQNRPKNIFPKLDADHVWGVGNRFFGRKSVKNRIIRPYRGPYTTIGGTSLW